MTNSQKLQREMKILSGEEFCQILFRPFRPLAAVVGNTDEFFQKSPQRLASSNHLFARARKWNLRLCSYRRSVFGSNTKYIVTTRESRWTFPSSRTSLRLLNGSSLFPWTTITHHNTIPFSPLPSSFNIYISLFLAAGGRDRKMQRMTLYYIGCNSTLLINPLNFFLPLWRASKNFNASWKLCWATKSFRILKNSVSPFAPIGCPRWKLRQLFPKVVWHLQTTFSLGRENENYFSL